MMFATGRRPNVKGLGLEAAGVKLGENGASRSTNIRRPSVPHIYAVGDVTDRISAHAGRDPRGPRLRRHACSAASRRAVDHTNVPTAVFSEPEVGVIGLTEAQAADELAKVDIYKTIVPADEGDAVRPRHPHVHEARGRRHDRPRGRLPYRRARTPAR